MQFLYTAITTTFNINKTIARGETQRHYESIYLYGMSAVSQVIKIISNRNLKLNLSSCPRRRHGCLKQAAHRRDKKADSDGWPLYGNHLGVGSLFLFFNLMIRKGEKCRSAISDFFFS